MLAQCMKPSMRGRRGERRENSKTLVVLCIQFSSLIFQFLVSYTFGEFAGCALLGRRENETRGIIVYSSYCHYTCYNLLHITTKCSFAIIQF